ncbi:MAG: efflux RND transporter periplasmic adaptor subunit [Deltaproteobacteria bacterium]|nr:efflux RND transporter periplasmic adaptor subunit [Deltaproteobacteria bacterium]
MKKLIRRSLQLLIAVLLIGLGYFGMNELKSNKPQIERRKLPPPTPTVRTIKIETKSRPVIIQGEGTVKPLKEINLVPQVGGKVIEVSPSLVNGGQFREGEVLLRIDPIDYELAVILADAKVKDAQSKLELAKEEAAAAKEEWRLIQGASSKSGEKPPPLVAKEPQLAAARAQLKADRANLRKARLNLERTKLKAPFNGRISEENVDIGQYVTLGQPLASLYSIDAAEIMVPLEDDDLRWLHIPGFTEGDGPGSSATVRARIGGRDRTWPGVVVRAEGKIDERTRMINAVIRVMNPYVKRPPLVSGLFVKVDIEGRILEDAAVIPRFAMRENNTVWVVEGNGRLAFRKIDLAGVQGENCLVQSGLNTGDLVVTSSMQAVTDGMAVQATDIGGKLVRGKPKASGSQSPDQIIAEIKRRLKLPDQQMQQVRPIMLEHLKEQEAIRKEYGGKGFAGIQDLVSNMRKLNSKTNGRLEKVVTAEQLLEYDKYQQELRAKARAAMGGPPG